MRLYLSEKQAMIAQNFQCLYKVAELALGEGKGPGDDPNVVKPQSKEQLQAAMQNVFG